MGALDTGLDYYRGVLELRGLRQELLSADIANASTPGFKAVDLDFREALADTLAGGSLNPGAAPPAAMLVSADVAGNGGAVPKAALRRAVKYQIGGQVSLDGNSVDLNFEKLQAAENALDYEAAVNFTGQIVNMLMTAIKGSAAGPTPSR